MLTQILQDAVFAAIAAIGFSAISNPPRRAYAYCAVVAAVGHSVRFWLMNEQFGLSLHIVAATLIASLLIGTLAVVLSPFMRTPAETLLFPSLLPMIPGIYAYKAFAGLAMCVIHQDPDPFGFYFYQFASNGLTCLFILICMAIGAIMPIFLLEKISFQATRNRNNS